MATDEAARELQRQCDAVVEKIKPLPGGHDPLLQGLICADLMALYIAGWAPQARNQMMVRVIDLMKSLVPFYAERLNSGDHPKGNA